MKQQKGFTLIELVVVIVILGVLAAVALPRFMNATDDAHTSAVQGTGGALAAGVALVRSQWELNRVKGTDTRDTDSDPKTNVLDFGDNTVDVNSSGWPVGTSATGSADACVEIWKGVLQGSAPVVATAAASGIDYVASYTAPDCTFSYSLDGSSPAKRTITYETDTGAVITDAQ